jgi:Transposase domain (DUF772)
MFEDDRSLHRRPAFVNDVLASLDGDFDKAYAQGGRPSIPPERLLRALLLQAFYTIRSERQLITLFDDTTGAGECALQSRPSLWAL